MKKALLVLVALMIATAAFAVDASKMTDQGTKALLFQAAGFNANMFNGGVGMKYYLAPGLALRPTLRFGFGTVTDKNDNVDTIGGYQTTYNDDKTTTTSFGLDLAVEKTMWTKGALNVNVGAGAGFGMATSKREYGEKYVQVAPGVITGTMTDKTERSSTNFGGALLLGAEWFITENVSLGGEYQFGLTMTSEGKHTRTQTTSFTNGGTTVTTTATTKSPLESTMSLGFQTVGVVLGFRF